MTLELPFSTTEASKRYLAKKYKIEGIKKQLRLKKREVSQRIDTLLKTLKQDMEILKEYQKTLEISNLVYKEAQRDFGNGRLDFNDLIDFSKALINDQKSLSLHRIKVIVLSVELLDYYNYFNQFVNFEEERK